VMPGGSDLGPRAYSGWTGRETLLFHSTGDALVSTG